MNDQRDGTNTLREPSTAGNSLCITTVMSIDDQQKSAPWRTSEAELRWKLALSLVDAPPPVPPKDPPKVTTTTTAAPVVAAAAETPITADTTAASRPGTAATNNTKPSMWSRPGTAKTTKSSKSIKMPFLLTGTMSSSRPGTANPRPSTAKTTTSEKRPNTAVTSRTALFSPTFTEATSLSAGESVPTTTAGRTWARLASKVTMTPLKPVKISNPMRGFGKSLSLRRYDSQGTVSTIPAMPAIPSHMIRDEEATIDTEKRPATSSTRRLSRTSTKTGKTIKYAAGKHEGIELSPQPSDDENDPLNWPLWKKDLNLIALLVTAALCNAMKTVLIPIAVPLATRLSASQVEIAALTAMPLLIAAFTSLASVTASKVYGKRPVYLASAAALLTGSLWNLRAPTLAQAMGARLFQGLGWGAFDVLLLASIHDTYFEHERRFRVAAHDVLCAISMWSPPIFGGLIERNSPRPEPQMTFEVLACFWAAALPLLVFAAPETAYDRWFSGSAGLPLAPSPLNIRRRSIGRFEVPVPTMAGLRSCLRRVVPVSDFRGFTDSRTLLQGPRAFLAPTTLLLAALTTLPVGALWGLSHTLSPLFGRSLDTAQTGSLMAAPLTAIVITTGLFILWSRCRTEADMPNRLLAAFLAVGASFCFVGILTFGIEVRVFRSGDASFPLLSVLLGLVAAGAYLLVSLSRPLIWRSARFTGSNLHVCLRNVADMDAGVRCWRGFLTGVFVLAFASAMQRSAPTEVALFAGTAGVKAGCIALATCQLAVAGAVGAVWWFKDESVRRRDGRVMGFVDLSMLKRSDSFFDYN
ncbi:major facilitator superfamily domain-containing protein [Plectosphaerella plurivora]|uniref:Major facilitator superfamily domain-containing protein n=1 Tax=Plectosphaerella plurivora TaxID=936078 RepID=A0A9P9ABR9_9PEZI|nr:major facilitator superfamily domain-containing protein [Plectosphaerella plurivora]